jgi:hypothetical protein
MSSSTLITDYLGSGTHASRPAAPPIPAGGTAFYYETDTTNTFVWIGASWVQINGGGASEPSISAFTTVLTHPGWDPLYSGAASEIILSNSNKTATPASGSPYNQLFGTPAQYTGKKYFEFVPGGTTFVVAGVAGGGGHFKRGNGGNFGQRSYGQIGWANDGTVKACNNTGSIITVATIQTWATGNNCCVAVDLDTKLIWFRTNGGNWNNNGSNDPVAEVGGIDLTWALTGASNNLIWPGANAGDTNAHVLHLLSADFGQTVPSGYAQWGA